MKRRYRRNSTKAVVTLVLVLCLIVATVTYYLMQPVILRFATSIAETIMLDCANEAIVNVLASDKVSYKDIVKELKNIADGFGKPFCQAHAPFPTMRDGDEEYKVSNFELFKSNSIAKL